MEVTITPDGNDCYVISCPTQMEWQARIDLVELLKQAAGDKPYRGVILDLDHVTYINSAGLGAIFALRKFARQAGADVVVARPNVTITRLLNTVNMSALVPVATSLDEARQKLDQRQPNERSA